MLEGVRVIDATRLLPGPLCTHWLALHGAEVLKLEHPDGGDPTRWLPPLIGAPPAGALFRFLNAGKKSVALDLGQAGGRRAFEALLAEADVLVDSFRPGVLSSFGFGSEALSARFPKLVSCSLTGYGPGRHAERPGHDLGYMARSGAIGLRPVVPSVQVADVGGAWAALAGIALALFARTRTGQGRRVDVSLTDVATSFGAEAWARWWAEEQGESTEVLLDGRRPCYSLYPVSDGWLAVCALEPKFWTAFCRALDLEALEVRGLDLAPEVRVQVAERLAPRTRLEWMEHFASVDTCVEPVWTTGEAASDPLLQERGVAPLARGHLGPCFGQGFELGEAPALGADTEEVLAGLKLSEIVRAEVLARAGRTG
ncbi:MAG: CoA transferase [Myxococcota bacterium]